MARILIIEDNVDIAAALRVNFEFEGHDVDCLSDGVQGLAAARTATHDLVILDIMLPRLDGFRILHTLRAEGVETPVLILTARGEEADRVRGFRWGTDDYVTKPFSVLELLARADRLLRRRPRGSDPAPAVQPVADMRKTTLRCFADVEINLAKREVLRGGAPVALRPREFDLLLALLYRRGAIASREDLLRDVWGYKTGLETRTVDTHIGELRRKLEPDPLHPRYLLTVRKAGYRLEDDPASARPVVADDSSPHP